MRFQSSILILPLTAAMLAACSGDKPSTPKNTVSLVAPIGAGGGSVQMEDSLIQAPKVSVAPHPVESKDAALYRSMKEKAEAGDAEARFEVAMMHLLGSGGAEKNRDMAVEMLKRAASEGSQRASNNLAAILISNGDRKEALTIYQKAAEEGDVDAGRNAAFLLAYEDDGVMLTGDPKRIEQAKDYLREASSKGDIFADSAMGAILADQGEIDEAIRWLEKPALSGVSQAMDRLSDIAASVPSAVNPQVVTKLKTMQQARQKG